MFFTFLLKPRQNKRARALLLWSSSGTSVDLQRIQTSSETVTALPAFHEGSHIMDGPDVPQDVTTDANNVKKATKMQ